MIRAAIADPDDNSKKDNSKKRAARAVPAAARTHRRGRPWFVQSSPRFRAMI
jgi:hypothetical protein